MCYVDMCDNIICLAYSEVPISSTKTKSSKEYVILCTYVYSYMCYVWIL